LIAACNSASARTSSQSFVRRLTVTQPIRPCYSTEVAEAERMGKIRYRTPFVSATEGGAKSFQPSLLNALGQRLAASLLECTLQ
jgi:hypothetical protein